MSSLFNVSQLLLAARPDLFVKTQEHDANDAESADLLWTAVSDDPTDLCEGEVILISHYGPVWSAAHDHADKVGGWPTVWSTSGNEDEVVRAVLAYLTEA